jgi:hypothetical protein
MTYAIVIAIFLKKNCTPEGVQRKKEIVFFSCIAFINLLLVSPFFSYQYTGYQHKGEK